MTPIPGIVASANSLSSPYWFSKYNHNSPQSKVWLTNQYSSGYFYPYMRVNLFRQSKYNGINWQRSASLYIARQPAVDSSENIYLANWNPNGTLSKVDNTGTNQWNYRISGVTLPAVATDGTNVYWVGVFNRSSTDRGLCVTKVNGSGSLIWQREIKRSDNLQLAATYVAYDASSDSIIINSAQGFDAYCVLKLSASTGVVSWIKQVKFDYAPGFGIFISCYGQSTELSVNQSNGSISFGVQIYQDPGAQNYGVLINLNSSGNLNWAKRYGVVNPISPEVATDSFGNVYGIWTTNINPAKCVLTKYNSSGTQLWSNYLNVVDAFTTAQYLPVSSSARFASVASTDDTVMFTAGQTNFAYFLRVPANGTKTGTYNIVPPNSTGGSIVGTYATDSTTTANESRCAIYNISYSETGTSNPLISDTYNPVGNPGTVTIFSKAIF